MKRILFCLLFIASVKIFNAQNKLAYLSYVFPQDSLAGFNETGANQAALKGGYFGKEYKVFIYRAKRNFINAKYGYQNFNSYDKNGSPVINTAPCLNEDFEATPIGSVSAISGWTITEGSNSGSCMMSGCCLTAATGSNTWVRQTPFVSPPPVSMTVPNSPLGGTKVLQMNNEVVNMGEIVRLEQLIPITASNCIIDYAYLCFMDGTGHACCDNPYMNILLYDCIGNIISVASTSIVVPGSSCLSGTPGFSFTSSSSGIAYFPAWQVKTANLSAYIGSCVKMQVTVGDCDGWAHYGYAYFDARCGGVTGIGNVALNEEKIKVYPNPNNGEFKIQADEPDIIIITNEVGQTIKTLKLNAENNYSATISGLANGIYFATGTGFRQKIVVMK